MDHRNTGGAGRGPLTRREFLKGLGAAWLSLTPVVAGCDLIGSDFRDLVSMMRGKGMALASTNLAAGTRVPPIDAHLPAVIQTATFALG